MPPCVTDADIIFCPVVSSLFLAQSQPSQIACLPYFHTVMDGMVLARTSDAGLKRCCTRLAENTRRNKSCLFKLVKIYFYSFSFFQDSYSDTGE